MSEQPSQNPEPEVTPKPEPQNPSVTPNNINESNFPEEPFAHEPTPVASETYLPAEITQIKERAKSEIPAERIAAVKSMAKDPSQFVLELTNLITDDVQVAYELGGKFDTDFANATIESLPETVLSTMSHQPELFVEPIKEAALAGRHQREAILAMSENPKLFSATLTKIIAENQGYLFDTVAKVMGQQPESFVEELTTIFKAEHSAAVIEAIDAMSKKIDLFVGPIKAKIQEILDRNLYRGDEYKDTKGDREVLGYLKEKALAPNPLLFTHEIKSIVANEQYRTGGSFEIVQAITDHPEAFSDTLDMLTDKGDFSVKSQLILKMGNTPMNHIERIKKLSVNSESFIRKEAQRIIKENPDIFAPQAEPADQANNPVNSQAENRFNKLLKKIRGMFNR